MDYYSEDAYERAIKRRIAHNREKGQKKRADEARRAYLAIPGKMELIVKLGDAVNRTKSSFYRSLFEGWDKWGSLSEKQEAAFLRSLAQDEERAAQRRVENAEAAGRSQHVGKVGERRDFRLTLIRMWSGEGFNGVYTGQVFEDAAGNQFAYLGNCLGMEVGQTRTIKATIKAHDERDGVKATKINRPALQEDRPEEAEFLAARFTNITRGIKLA